MVRDATGTTLSSAKKDIRGRSLERTEGWSMDSIVRQTGRISCVTAARVINLLVMEPGFRLG